MTQETDSGDDPGQMAGDEEGGESIRPTPLGLTAIFGHSRLGPTRQPIWCRTESAYNQVFGDHADGPVLAAAVRGFFENGGERCAVVNLGAAERPLASGDLGVVDDLNEVELLCAPGKWEPADTAALLAYGASRGCLLVLLDCPPDLTRKMATYRPPEATCAALYAPWLRVVDPSRAADVDVPPSGHMAGLLARVARERGVHKAPANEPLRGLVGLSYELSQAEQDILHPRGINCIRRLPKLEGIRPWGAQTLAAQEPFRTLAACRVFSHIVRSLRFGCPWLSGAASDADTWARLEAATRHFLHDLWDRGALLGGRPEDAFRVRCDAGLNAPDRRDRGDILIQIGLALTRPGAFYTVTVRIEPEPGPAPATAG